MLADGAEVPRRLVHEVRATFGEVRPQQAEYAQQFPHDIAQLGAVTAVDPVLQCMHAAMSQAPAWCAHLSGRARDRAIDVFADTVMMLVGVLPRAGTS